MNWSGNVLSDVLATCRDVLFGNRIAVVESHKKRPTEASRALNNGGEDGNRTHDLVIANDALSQLSYSPGALQV